MSTYYYTPLYPVKPGDAKNNREAFEEALSEYADHETRYKLTSLIYGVAEVLMTGRGLSKDTALAQATEFVAACVWNKATAP